MSDVKLYQKAALSLGASDLVYASRSDGADDGKASLGALSAIVHGVNGGLYAGAGHTHAYADLTGRPTLGALASLDTVNGGHWSGQDLALTDGGTGASTAAAARTNLDVYSKAEVDAAVGGGIGFGATFPGSPSNNDLFYRTDRDILYFYDGVNSRWLSAFQFTVGAGPGTQLYARNQTTAAVGLIANPYAGLYDILVERVALSTQLIATTTGTNYVTGSLNIQDGAAYTLISSFSTQNDTTATWQQHPSTPNAICSSTVDGFQFDMVEVGTITGFYAAVAIVGRLVG